MDYVNAPFFPPQVNLLHHMAETATTLLHEEDLCACLHSIHTHTHTPCHSITCLKYNVQMCPYEWYQWFSGIIYFTDLLFNKIAHKNFLDHSVAFISIMMSAEIILYMSDV